MGNNITAGKEIEVEKGNQEDKPPADEDEEAAGKRKREAPKEKVREGGRHRKTGKNK